jgi:hypothetical protein
MTLPEAAPAPGRSCDGCTMCCKIFGIPELAKPRHKWCAQCEIGVGCRIYADRPPSCREFVCGWLIDPAVPEHWKPTRARMVLTTEDDGRRLVIHLDAGRPDAWRKPPYYAEIKHLAREAARGGRQLILWQGPNAIAILPDREKFLGPVAPGQIIVTTERDRPGGGELDVEVMNADDPALAGPAPSLARPPK